MVPRAFKAGEIEIRLSSQAGNAAYRPWELQLSGAGGARLSHDGKEWRLAYPAADVVALLNELNEIRFFELPDRYGEQDFAQLMNDGSVQMIGKGRTGSGGDSVCVRIAAYEKCVRFGPATGPAELQRILRAALEGAQRRAGAQPAK